MRTGYRRFHGARHALLRALLAAFALHAQAQDDDDASALMLADKTEAQPVQASNWRSFLEGAAGQSDPRPGATQGVQRLSLDARYDGSLAPDWRLMFSDRLDVNSPPQTPGDNAVNTLKEAYLSWQAPDNVVLDMGRVNVRNGLSLGYNPTDYFKAGALRSVVAVDPQSMKEDRQGSVVLRGQQLWSGGALTALYSPKLGDQPDSGAYSLDVGATNSVNRSLLSYSPTGSEAVSVQFLLFNQDQRAPQCGFNAAALLNDATVVNVEWSGGQSTSQLSQALAQYAMPSVDDTAYSQRWVTGVTYTTSNKMSFSAEYEYNSQGLSQVAWNQLRAGNPALYGLYENWVQYQQELPTQRASFLYFNWQDAFISRLDLSAMQRYDLADNSSMVWLEARYHLLDHAEFAVQWLRNQGGALSDYGVQPVAQSVLVVVRGYF